MANTEEHCQDCLAALGARFKQVHDWLDELQQEYGPMHRPFRHHAEGVEIVRARWGDAAARAAEIHILRDTGGVIPTSDELRDYWGISVEDIVPEDD